MKTPTTKLNQTLGPIALSLLALISAHGAWALEPIPHTYQSVRTSGMGGVHLTTGLYEENFYGNPARATENPAFRFTLIEPTFELNSGTVTTVGKITGGDGDTLKKISNTAGTNNHGRIQMSNFSLYFPPSDRLGTAFAVGLVTATEFDVALRRSYDANVGAVAESGVNFTVAQQLMENRALSVGLNGHYRYRFTTTPDYGLIDMIRRAPFQSGGGAGLDFDLGATYRLPVEFRDWRLTTGASIQNLLGAKYTQATTGNLAGGAPGPNRAFGLGISASRPELWKFTNALVAFEINDIGNNPGASLFRTLHLGGEARYGVLIPRLGINQGYLCAGLGLDLRFMTLDLATYGEEMSLNAGGLEDRRYALKLAFQIAGSRPSVATAAGAGAGAPMGGTPELKSITPAPAEPEPTPAAPQAEPAPAPEKAPSAEPSTEETKL